MHPEDGYNFRVASLSEAPVLGLGWAIVMVLCAPNDHPCARTTRNDSRQRLGYRSCFSTHFHKDSFASLRHRGVFRAARRCPKTRGFRRQGTLDNLRRNSRVGMSLRFDVQRRVPLARCASAQPHPAAGPGCFRRTPALPFGDSEGPSLAGDGPES